MKRLLLLTFLLVFAVNAVCFAAVSGSKSKSFSPSTPSKPPTTQTAPDNNSTGYKPSAPATSYSEKAPAAKPGTQQQTVQQPSTGGGFMRSLATFGGGMLLGGMLGGMFGSGGSGMFASIIGMLFNVILLAGIFMAGRYLWGRYKKSKEIR